MPINSIKRILGSLIEHGRVIRADLGITRVFATNEGLLVLSVGLRFAYDLVVKPPDPYSIRALEPGE